MPLYHLALRFHLDLIIHCALVTFIKPVLHKQLFYVCPAFIPRSHCLLLFYACNFRTPFWCIVFAHNYHKWNVRKPFFKSPHNLCRLISPKTPLRRRKSAFPPYRFMLCRSHPLRVAIPQRFLIPCICTPPGLAASGGIYTRAPIRGSALMCKVSAMRNCVSNGVRTSRCRADFFRLSKSRCDLPSRRAPDRLSALLTAFRLSIAFCLRLAFTGGSDPACALSRT